MAWPMTLIKISFSAALSSRPYHPRVGRPRYFSCRLNWITSNRPLSASWLDRLTLRLKHIELFWRLKIQWFQGLKKFLQNNSSLKLINHMNTALILKVDNPESLNNYWPIGHCNVSYKIIIKRLKPLLKLLISYNQGAFAPWAFYTW